jgi:hypothetical protein
MENRNFENTYENGATNLEEVLPGHEPIVEICQTPGLPDAMQVHHIVPLPELHTYLSRVDDFRRMSEQYRPDPEARRKYGKRGIYERPAFTGLPYILPIKPIANYDEWTVEPQTFYVGLRFWKRGWTRRKAREWRDEYFCHCEDVRLAYGGPTADTVYMLVAVELRNPLMLGCAQHLMELVVEMREVHAATVAELNRMNADDPRPVHVELAPLCLLFHDETALYRD